MPSESNVAVSVKPDSTSDVATKVSRSTAISSSKGSNGNYVISSSEARNVHETGTHIFISFHLGNLFENALNSVLWVENVRNSVLGVSLLNFSIGKFSKCIENI